MKGKLGSDCGFSAECKVNRLSRTCCRPNRITSDRRWQVYARHLFSWPSEPAYQPLTDEVDEIEPEILNALIRIIDLKGGQGEDGGFAPRLIELSPEARGLFEGFRQFLDKGKAALDGRGLRRGLGFPQTILAAVLLCCPSEVG